METILLEIYNQIPNIGPIIIGAYLVYFRKEVDKRFNKMDLSLLRLRLLNLIQHTPKQSSIIKKLFTEYKAMGGNCEIDDVYTEWKKIHG